MLQPGALPAVGALLGRLVEEEIGTRLPSAGMKAMASSAVRNGW
jgi:hypothetical protein